MEKLLEAYRALIAAQAEATVASIWTAAWHGAQIQFTTAEEAAA